MYPFYALLTFSMLMPFAGCRFKQPGSQVQNTDWPALSNSHCTIHYESRELRAEAEQYGRWLDSIVSDGEKFFADSSLSERIRNCKLFLHLTPNDLANASTFTLTNLPPNERGEIIGPEMHFLGAKQHPANSRTVVDEPKDDFYFYKTLAHEYLTMFLDLVGKDAKWRPISNSPNWFSQGLEEYVGLHLSSEHSRQVTMPLYLAFAQRNPNVVNFDFGVMVGSSFDYVGGTIFVKFLIDAFGKESLFRALRSQQKTLSGALLEVYGPMETVQAKWQSWSAAHIRADNSAVSLERVLNPSDLRNAGLSNDLEGCTYWGFVIPSAARSRSGEIMEALSKSSPKVRFGQTEVASVIGLSGNNDMDLITLYLCASPLPPPGTKVTLVPQDESLVQWRTKELVVAP